MNIDFGFLMTLFYSSKKIVENFNLQKKPFKPINESSKAQGDEPWNRLYKKATLSSKRNQYHYYDPKSPSDKLDFAIKTIYDQHCDIFQNSNEVVYQQETYTDNHGFVEVY